MSHVSKNYAFTSWSSLDKTLTVLKELKSVYFWGFALEKAPNPEEGSDGLHYQGVVVFGKSRRENAVWDDFHDGEKQIHVKVLLDPSGPKAHWERYCKKWDTKVLDANGQIQKWEWGLLPERADSYAEAYALAVAGKLKEITPAMIIRHKRSLEELMDENRPKPVPLAERCGIWVWGATKLGKSTQIQVNMRAYLYSKKNGWWCGYKDEEDVLIDEVTQDNFKRIYEDIMDMTTTLPFKINPKHKSEREIRPKRVWITSNETIQAMVEQFVPYANKPAFYDRFGDRIINPQTPHDFNAPSWVALYYNAKDGVQKIQQEGEDFEKVEEVQEIVQDRKIVKTDEAGGAEDCQGQRGNQVCN